MAKDMILKGALFEWDEMKASGELCEYTRHADVVHVKVLLDGGCDVNAKDYDLRTCMHLAASEGVRHIVTILVELGGDVNAKDRWDGTPLAE